MRDPLHAGSAPPHRPGAHPEHEASQEHEIGSRVALDVLTDLTKVRNIGIMAHIDAGKDDDD